MKTRMTALALLVATLLIRRNAAPERHHATSRDRAACHAGGRWREAERAAADFLLAQRAAIDEDAAAGQYVNPPTWSGNDPRRPDGAAARAELARAVPRDWRADA
jgi:hypothetical protein